MFDLDTHATYAAVSANVLAIANGYSPGTLTLVGVTEDDTNDRGEVEFSDFTWTASGGSIGPSNGAIIYDDTSSDDTVIGFIDFGSAQTATDGGVFKLANLLFRLS